MSRRRRLHPRRLRLEYGQLSRPWHSVALGSCRRRRSLGGLRRQAVRRHACRFPSRGSPWRRRLVCSLVGGVDLRWSMLGVVCGVLGRVVETDFVVGPGRVSTAGVGVGGVVGMGLVAAALDVVADLDILFVGSGILVIAKMLGVLLVWTVVFGDKRLSLAG